MSHRVYQRAGRTGRAVCDDLASRGRLLTLAYKLELPLSIETLLLQLLSIFLGQRRRRCPRPLHFVFGGSTRQEA